MCCVRDCEGVWRVRVCEGVCYARDCEGVWRVRVCESVCAVRGVCAV